MARRRRRSPRRRERAPLHARPRSSAVWPGPRVLLALALGSTEAVLVAAAVMHLIAIPFAMRIPKVHVTGRLPIVEDVELRGGAVTFAANAQSAMRAGVGFLAFFIAFNLKVGGEPGVVLRPRDRGGRRGRLLRHLHRRVPAPPSQRGDAARVWRSAPRGWPRSSLLCSTRDPAVLLVALTTGVAASVGAASVRQPHAAPCPRRREGPGVRSVRDPVPDRVGHRRARRGARPAGQRNRPRRPRRRPVRRGRPLPRQPPRAASPPARGPDVSRSAGGEPAPVAPRHRECAPRPRCRSAWP